MAWRGMRRLALSVLLLFAPIPALAAPAFPGWLAGTWQMENGAAWADELWMAPRGDVMLGVGRQGFGPEVEEWRTARIVKRGDALVYAFRAKDGAAVEWPLVVASGDAIEFAGAGGTFPQRVRFSRAGQLLMIELSQLDGSEAVRRNYRPVETAPKD